jgi:hypothetical protein
VTIPVCRLRSARPLRAIATLCAIVASVTASDLARADVRVGGDVDAVRLEASAASVAEILAALADRFPLRYRASLSLDDAISVTYAGSLEQVLARTLNGFNYVLKRENGTIELVVIGRHGSRAVAVEPPLRTPTPSATTWRSKAAPTKP